MKLRLIEFTTDTFAEDGTPQRAKGDKLRVDPASAKSFVDKKKVARYLDVETTAPSPKASPEKPAEGAS